MHILNYANVASVLTRHGKGCIRSQNVTYFYFNVHLQILLFFPPKNDDQASFFGVFVFALVLS